jgi:hypothetical protein
MDSGTEVSLISLELFNDSKRRFEVFVMNGILISDWGSRSKNKKTKHW